MKIIHAKSLGALLLMILLVGSNGCMTSDLLDKAKGYTGESVELSKGDKVFERSPRPGDPIRQYYVIQHPKNEDVSKLHFPDNMPIQVKYEWYDETDPWAFVKRLRQQSDPISAFLWQRLSKPDQVMLLNYQPSVPSQDETKARARVVVIQNLNRIIEAQSIYERERFQSISLRPITIDLLEQSPTGPELARLNRLLLEDAYPLELEKLQFRAFKPKPGYYALLPVAVVADVLIAPIVISMWMVE